MGLFDSLKNYSKKKLGANRGGLKNFTNGLAGDAFDNAFDSLVGKEAVTKGAAKPKAGLPQPLKKKKKTAPKRK